MSISPNEFFSAIQSKLPPKTKLIWDKEPGRSWHEQSCTLTAFSLDNPQKKFTMDIPNGLTEEPLDDLAQAFIDHFVNELDK